MHPGKRLAFVEVKRRLTRDDDEGAVSVSQAARIRRAADLWLAHRPRYHGHARHNMHTIYKSSVGGPPAQ